MEKTIIALERAALERWNQGDPDGFLELSAPDVTYFDPFFEQKLEGFGQLKEYYDRIRGQVKVDRYEMIRPTVQTTPGVAVLTYNLLSHCGPEVYRWNCTEVYRLESGGQWKIVHTHWSFVRPGQ